MSNQTSLTRLRRLLCGAAVTALLALAGCAGTPTTPDAAQSQSGVTVYGTVDAGIGRTSR